MIILNEAKVKYDKLDELLEDYTLNVLFSEQVNIIIDLKEIFKKFFRPDINLENYDRVDLIKEITADIVNTVAHYRNYFYKKNKYTSFFLLFSTKKCEKLIEEYPEYKSEYYDKYLLSDELPSKIIKNITGAIKLIIDNTPHTYYIDTSEYDEFIYAKHLKTTFKQDEMNLILTNDTMFFQLLDDNTYILNLKGIKSEIITNKNSLNFILKKDEKIDISNNLITLILTLSGVKKYSIKNIPGVANNKAVSIIESLVKEGKINDAATSLVPIKFSELGDTKIDKLLKNNMELISKNYDLIKGDMFYSKHRLKLISTVNISDCMTSISFFKDLNSKTFSTHPILVDMLLKGEKV